jgi:hypothetical protein
MSPGNAMIYIDNIVRALSETDPDNADAYAANGARYKDRDRGHFRADPRGQIEALPEDRRWLVSSEAAFSYLAADFGLREASIWAINADSQGSPQQVRRIIDLIRDNDMPVIFSESTVSPESRTTGGARNRHRLWWRSVCGFAVDAGRTGADLSRSAEGDIANHCQRTDGDTMNISGPFSSQTNQGSSTPARAPVSMCTMSRCLPQRQPRA